MKPVPTMKLLLMPKEPTWWIWLATVALLALGLAGYALGFIAAIAVSVAQAVWFLAKHGSMKPYPVQIRVAYAACLLAYLIPGFNWLFWAPTLGTVALLLFGYCLMARLLSLMPWNRQEAMSAVLLRRTFLTPPIPGNARHGLPAGGCADSFAH
jgi:hypothetical protein